MPSIFSRISTKLATLSAIGIFLVTVMLLTVWQGGHHLYERAKYRDELLIVSRDLVDAKASWRGMQVGVRDLAGHVTSRVRRRLLAGETGRTS